jgi:hypothetical protein
MLFILLTIAAIVIYITRPPKENYKVNPDHYDIDYNNLMECIGRAKNKQQLSDCCTAVYDFHKRNKEDLGVDSDVDELIKKI